MPVPLSWGADKDGNPTCNPEDIIHDGGLLPLGGSEESSGYKGYGLMFMAEILCGILSGSGTCASISTQIQNAFYK